MSQDVMLVSLKTYDEAVTSVRTTYRKTGEFPVTICLHRWSALSPFSFGTNCEQVNHICSKMVPCCMLFLDDIVLVDESMDGMNVKYKRWREALESKEFKITHTKTEYMNIANSVGMCIDLKRL